jgi:hypothetical protein
MPLIDREHRRWTAPAPGPSLESGQTKVAVALVAVIAFRHYDLVYRLLAVALVGESVSGWVAFAS